MQSRLKNVHPKWSSSNSVDRHRKLSHNVRKCLKEKKMGYPWNLGNLLLRRRKFPIKIKVAPLKQSESV